MVVMPLEHVLSLLGESSSVLKLYLYLLSKAKSTDNEFVQESQYDIASSCNLSQPTIIQCLKVLRSLGLISVYSQRKPNRPNKYQLVPINAQQAQIAIEQSTPENPEQDYRYWLRTLNHAEYQRIKRHVGFSQLEMRRYYENTVRTKT